MSLEERSETITLRLGSPESDAPARTRRLCSCLVNFPNDRRWVACYSTCGPAASSSLARRTQRFVFAAKPNAPGRQSPFFACISDYYGGLVGSVSKPAPYS